MTWRVKTGPLLLAQIQIHGYLLGLKPINTLIVDLQNIKFTNNTFYNIKVLIYIKSKLFLCCI